MSSLTIKNLNKIYNPGKNEVHAVKDFNLEIEDGEFVALLGPSGCGKTSTLRMIVGLESITSGSILFDDVEINHLSPEQRNVAMAFESYALYPNFTIFENLAFPLEVKNNSSSEMYWNPTHTTMEISTVSGKTDHKKLSNKEKSLKNN